MDLSIQAERVTDYTDKAENGNVEPVGVGSPNPYATLLTTPSYLAAPCGLANPQSFHRSSLDLSIQAERVTDYTDKAENGNVEPVGVGFPNPLGEETSPLRLATY